MFQQYHKHDSFENLATSSIEKNSRKHNKKLEQLQKQTNYVKAFEQISLEE